MSCESLGEDGTVTYPLGDDAVGQLLDRRRGRGRQPRPLALAPSSLTAAIASAVLFGASYNTIPSVKPRPKIIIVSVRQPRGPND